MDVPEGASGDMLLRLALEEAGIGDIPEHDSVMVLAGLEWAA